MCQSIRVAVNMWLNCSFFYISEYKFLCNSSWPQLTVCDTLWNRCARDYWRHGYHRYSSRWVTSKTATNQNDHDQNGHKRKRPQTKTATKRYQNGHILSTSKKTFDHQIFAIQQKFWPADGVPLPPPKKKFNCKKKLKFALKFSVFAHIISGLAGVLSRNFFRRRAARRGR